MPGYSPKETLQQRADGVHKYMAGLYGVKTFYEKRLDWLASLPQSPAVQGEMDSNQRPFDERFHRSRKSGEGT